MLHCLLFDKYEQDGPSWPLTKLIHQILELVFQKRSDEVWKIINEPGIGKNTPLHMACFHKGQKLIKCLLNRGAKKSLFSNNCECEIPANLMSTETLRDFLDQQIQSEGKFLALYFNKK